MTMIIYSTTDFKACVYDESRKDEFQNMVPVLCGQAYYEPDAQSGEVKDVDWNNPMICSECRRRGADLAKEADAQ